MNSNVASLSRVPPTRDRARTLVKLRGSRPLEIDVDRPAERIEKISRACLFVPCERERKRERETLRTSAAFFVESLLPALFPHTRKNARANLTGHVPDPIFRLTLRGGRSPNMANASRRDSTDWRNVGANVSQESMDSEEFRESPHCDCLFLDLNNGVL